MQHFVPLVLALLVGALWLILGLQRTRERLRDGNRKRSLLDYFFLWPLLLDNASAEEKDHRRKRLLKGRELLGLLLLSILMVLVWVFQW